MSLVTTSHLGQHIFQGPFTDAVSFPKIQILSARDWFSGKRALLPSTKVNLFKTAEARADQASLL